MHLPGSKLFHSRQRPKLRLALRLVSAAIFTLLPATSFGVTAGQTDNFEDGTTQFWAGPGTVNVPTSGPAGANDNYLQVSSGSFGGGPRMLTFNQSQWLGDYLSAGVSSISMDLRNFGSSSIPVRIGIRENTINSVTPGYSSTTPFNLPADGLWHTAVFSLTAMTPINSPQPLAADLANVADFRLLASVAPSLVGDLVNARIGVEIGRAHV